MRIVLAILLLITLSACQSATDGTPPPQAQADTQNTEGYTLEAVPGSDLYQAIKLNDQQQVIETGFFLNGLPQGTWKFYDPLTKEFPEKVINYHQGVMQGLYLEINERGQITLKANYLNNELHGDWGSYKFGRPLKTATYINGQLDGPYREYTSTTGTLQREIYYKMGKEHGTYRYFDEDGHVTVEYQYENGEKVSGGIVDTR